MVEREICEYCKSTFKNKSILKTHINTNKKCLISRGLTLSTEYICEGCNFMFITLNHLHVHYETCKDYLIFKIIKTHKEQLKENEIKYWKKK